MEAERVATTKAKPIVGTWLLLDSCNEASHYPGTGFGLSDHPQVHLLYWRCIACYFASAFRVLSPAYQLVLYTTATQFPQAVQAVLAACKVQIVRVPLKHLPPVGYLGAWRNQFYILDVIRHIGHGLPADALILDADCLFVSSIDPLFARLNQEGLLTYKIDYKPDAEINGLSRLEMKELFSELRKEPLAETPVYYGGEIFAATAEELKKIDREIDDLWAKCLFRAAHGLPKLNEEAHFLSYLYLKLGYRDATANDFIRRIWTQRGWRNARKEDLSLPIWHVPAEKRYGLTDLYGLVLDRKSWFWCLPPTELWKARLAALVGIPKAPLAKRAKDLCRGATHKLAESTYSGGSRDKLAFSQ